jgi:hypothetical protein
MYKYVYIHTTNSCYIYVYIYIYLHVYILTYRLIEEKEDRYQEELEEIEKTYA